MKKEQTLKIIQTRIKERLDQLEMSARGVGVAAGIGTDAINNIMRGSVPDAHKLGEIATTLKTTADYLLGKSDAPEVAAPSITPELSIIIKEVSQYILTKYPDEKPERQAAIISKYILEIIDDAGVLGPDYIRGFLAGRCK